MKVIPGLRDLIEDRKFDDAVKLLVALEKERELSLPELVFKGIWMQLGSESSPYTPEDVKRVFEHALEIDEDYVPALIELGFYQYVLQDDPATAMLLFERAIEISARQLKEAIEGKLKCLEDLHSAEAARSFLRKVTSNCFDLKSLEDKIGK